MLRRVWLLMSWIGMVGFPLIVLIPELLSRPEAWDVWTEHRRILGLLRNTLLLAGGTSLLAVPLGTWLGFVFWRTDAPGRNWLRRVVIISMFVPLPLFATAWQMTLSIIGMGPESLFLNDGGAGTWSAWNRGMVTAVLIHSAGAIPWVIWLSGQAFAWSDQAAEEDAILAGGIWHSIRRVTLPSAWPSIGLAAVWVAVHTSSEIAVTDMMQVRTFAEEVYAQFTRPDPDTVGGADFALARSLAAAMPASLLIGIVVSCLIIRWQRALPPVVTPPDDRRVFHLGQWRLLTGLVASTLVGLFTLVPFASLVHKVGLTTPGDIWSLETAFLHLRLAWDAQYGRILATLATSVVSGVICVLLAIGTCRALVTSYRWRLIAFAMTILLWTLPGPILGFGLKQAIDVILMIGEHVGGEGPSWIRTALYDGPSPLPVAWASIVRFLPIAMVLLWPIVTKLPDNLREAARTDGAGAWMEWRHAVLPLVAPAAMRAILVIAALSLGEIGASRLVQTPGGQTFAQEIFQQMHFGVNNHLAAMCLILLGIVCVPASLVPGLVGRWIRPETSTL